MAPVGSFESLAAALNAGADSIYFGVAQLNMRARASHNFTLEEVHEVAQRCHEAGVKCYITMNTLLYDHDLSLMRQIIDTAKKAGVDAGIIQDIAALQYATEVGLPVHASTQLSISNYEAVKFYSQYADTIVLAREVDLPMIKKICERIHEENVCGPAGKPVKIEIFVHGALCIAQSGRCQMSLLQNNTSAQRGACLQECRRKYRLIDEETGKEMQLDNQYILSPTDLCTLSFLDKVVEAGVSVFKIEGRGRTADYVDTTVRVYKEASEAILAGTFTPEKVHAWMQTLEKVYNRGFTEGYYLGRPLPEMSGHPDNRSPEERIFSGVVNHYFPKAGIAEVQVQAHEIQKGERLVIMGINTGVVYTDVTDMMRDEAHVESSGKPALVTVPVPTQVRKNDKVYILKKRADVPA